MPPIECLEKGCVNRMDGFEKRLDKIDNVEDGALAQLHEKANGKVSFSLFVWIIAATFTFTGIATAALYTSRKDLFEGQDKRIDEINAAQDRLVQYMILRLDKQEETLTMLANALAEHRAFTGEQMAALKKKVIKPVMPEAPKQPEPPRPTDILKGSE